MPNFAFSLSGAQGEGGHFPRVPQKIWCLNQEHYDKDYE